MSKYRRCCTHRVLSFLTDEKYKHLDDSRTICGSSLSGRENKCDCHLNMTCFMGDENGPTKNIYKGERDPDYYLVTCKDCIKIMKENGL